jgi:hypothetical protein
MPHLVAAEQWFDRSHNAYLDAVLSVGLIGAGFIGLELVENFIKRGIATTDADGVAFTDEVPDAAVLGSFWAVPDEGRLVSMNAGWKVDESTETRSSPTRARKPRSSCTTRRFTAARSTPCWWMRTSRRWFPTSGSR